MVSPGARWSGFMQQSETHPLSTTRNSRRYISIDTSKRVVLLAAARPNMTARRRKHIHGRNHRKIPSTYRRHLHRTPTPNWYQLRSGTRRSPRLHQLHHCLPTDTDDCGTHHRPHTTGDPKKTQPSAEITSESPTHKMQHDP